MTTLADTQIAPEEQMSSSGQDSGVVPSSQPVAPQPTESQPTSAPQPAPTTNQPPVQVVAAHPKAHLFSSLLNVLGGGNRTEYNVDPQTGTMRAVSVPQTKGALAKSILAGAITGLMSGGAAEHGPGSAGRGAAEGFNAVLQQRQQQDQQAQQMAKEDYSRQEQAKVRQMQTIESNLRMYSLAQDIGRKDKDAQDALGDQNLIDSFEDQGMVVNDNASGKEALDPTKYPKDRYLVVAKPKSAYERTNDSGQAVYRTPDGQITTEDGPGNIPLYNHRYVIVDNNATVPLRETTTEQTGPNTKTISRGGILPWVKDAIFYGRGGPAI